MIEERKSSKCRLMALLILCRLKGHYIVTEKFVYLNISFNLSRNEKKILSFDIFQNTFSKILLAI